jgi:hypothetical protein
VAVSAKNIYGFSNNKLFSYELNSFTLIEYQLPSFFGDYTAIKAINGKIYLLKDNGIYIYSVN